VWTLAGVVAIKAMDGPEIEWKAGRTDFVDDSLLPPRGRLPDGSQAQDHIRHVFYRMGFNDQEIVALSGAHNLGRCHSDRSGFEGKWVNNATRFSNQYYKLLLKLKWEKKQLNREGAPWQWVARTAAMDEDDEPLMMLPTDYSLVQDKAFKVWVEKYADDKDLFYDHFSKVFAKLIELGLHRDEDGIARFSHLEKGNYESAPQKSDQPGAAGVGRDGEAEKAAKENKEGVPMARARL
jgi:cytochrome c peroxidase